MGNIVQRFLSFDKMIGTTVIKVLYYIGLAFIVLGTIFGMFGALMSMGQSFIGGLGLLVFMPIMGAIALLFWRFMCEIYMLFFKISDDLSEIKAMKSTKKTFD